MAEDPADFFVQRSNELTRTGKELPKFAGAEELKTQVADMNLIIQALVRVKGWLDIERIVSDKVRDVDVAETIVSMYDSMAKLVNFGGKELSADEAGNLARARHRLEGDSAMLSAKMTGELREWMAPPKVEEQVYAMVDVNRTNINTYLSDLRQIIDHSGEPVSRITGEIGLNGRGNRDSYVNSIKLAELIIGKGFDGFAKKKRA